MIQQLKLITLTVGLTLLLSAGAQAAPVCLAATSATSLTAQNAQGACDFNGYTFLFRLVSATNEAAPGLTDAAVNNNTAVQLTAIGAMGIRVEYMPTNTTKSWQARADTNATFNYRYDIKPIDPNVAMDAALFRVVNANETSAKDVTAFKDLTSFVTLGGHPINVADADADSSTFENLSGTTSFTPPLAGTVHVLDSLSLSHFGSDQGFVGSALHPGRMVNDLGFTLVPEPASLILSGIGLLGLGVWRRRKV